VTVEEEPVEEKKFVNVKLMGFDPSSKIKVIKEVRAVAGLGIKEVGGWVGGVVYG
jgi:large subunit ribosomal protein L7/L12